MAAKKRKRGFDVQPSGPSDAGWVYRSDQPAPPPDETPAAAPATTPVGKARKPRSRGTVHPAAGTYTRGAVATSPPTLKENDMQTNTTTGAQPPGTLLVNGVKALGEIAIVPGASLIVDGEVKSGVFHAAGGLLGAAILGPVLGPLTWLAIGLDSYSRSVSGRTIIDQFSKKSKLAA